MNNYKVVSDNSSVSICYKCEDFSKAFIDIYVKNEEINSVFDTVKDAKLFAEVIARMLYEYEKVISIGDN